MFNSVGVFRHPAARFHCEFPHGEVWGVLRSNKYLYRRLLPRFYSHALEGTTGRDPRFEFRLHDNCDANEAGLL